MIKFLSVLAAATLSLSAASTVGQVPKFTVAELRAQCGAECDPVTHVKAQSQQAKKHSTKASLADYGSTPSTPVTRSVYFVAYSNLGEAGGSQDNFLLTAIFINQVSTPVYFVVTTLKETYDPVNGNNAVVLGDHFLNGPNGSVVNSVDYGGTINVFEGNTSQVGFGETLIMDIQMYDANSGNFIQQAYSRFTVGQPSYTYFRSNDHINSTWVETDPTNGAQVVTLGGQFYSQNLSVVLTDGNGWVFPVPVTKTGNQQLKFGVELPVGIYSVTVHSADTVETTTCRNCLNIDNPQ